MQGGKHQQACWKLPRKTFHLCCERVAGRLSSCNDDIFRGCCWCCCFLKDRFLLQASIGTTWPHCIGLEVGEREIISHLLPPPVCLWRGREEVVSAILRELYRPMAPSTENGKKGSGGDAPESSYDDMEETLIRVASAKSLVDLSKSGSLDAASAEIDQSSNAMQTSPKGSPKVEAPASAPVRPTSATQTLSPPVNRQIDRETSGAGVDVGAAAVAAATAAASSALSSSVGVTNEPTNKALTTVASKPIAPAGQPTSQTGSSASPPAATASRSSPTSSSVTSSRQPTPGSSRPTRSTKSKGTALRRGKWTPEEEAYVARVIHDFNTGFLNAPAGTTLRSYLSDKLQCDPMRITKKFTGDSCIGKRVFHPAIRSDANANLIDTAQVSPQL